MSTINAITLRGSSLQNTSGVNALLIDSAGRASRPNVPCFSAKQLGGSTINGNVILQTIILNNGNNFSTTTGNFTAPVPGLYYFSFTGFTDNTASGSNNIEIRKNGTAVCRTYTSEATSTYRPFAVCTILELAINDTVRPWTGVDLHGNDNPIFSGFLL